MGISFYGNCDAKGIPCLVTADLTTSLFEVSGSARLRSKKEYYEELVELGLLRDSDISPDYFPEITGRRGEVVKISGELSDKPEQGFFVDFYGVGSVIPSAQVGISGILREEVRLDLSKFLWKDDNVEVGFKRIDCPFCGDRIEYGLGALIITSWGTAFEANGDLGHVKECGHCKAFVAISCDTPREVFQVLVNYAERLYDTAQGPLRLDEEKIIDYLERFDTKRILLPKLTVFDLKDRTPSTLYYLYAIKRRGDI